MDTATKLQLQADYEVLEFGMDAPSALRDLAEKYKITLDELLDNINP